METISLDDLEKASAAHRIPSFDHPTIDLSGTTPDTGPIYQRIRFSAFQLLPQMFRLLLFLTLPHRHRAGRALVVWNAGAGDGEAGAPAAAIWHAGCPRPAMRRSFTARRTARRSSAASSGSRRSPSGANDPKAAAAREGTRRFGLAVPPLSGIVAVFAVLVGKDPGDGSHRHPVRSHRRRRGVGHCSRCQPNCGHRPCARAMPARNKSFPSRDDEECRHPLRHRPCMGRRAAADPALAAA